MPGVVLIATALMLLSEGRLYRVINNYQQWLKQFYHKVNFLYRQLHVETAVAGQATPVQIAYLHG